tara:strand:- start:4363 stop:4500 length:138 start_codon:yes stop_codon:yes gene_type:complete
MTNAFTAKLIEYASQGFMVVASQYRGGALVAKEKTKLGETILGMY